MLDHSPHNGNKSSFGLEWSDAYWNGPEANTWAVLFVCGVLAFMVAAILTRQK